MKFSNIHHFIQLFITISLVQAKNIPIDFLYQNDNNGKRDEMESANKWNLKENDVIFNWKASNPYNSNIHFKKCPSDISDQGYKCCVNECTYMYTDNHGNWSVENGEWCLCVMDSYEYDYDDDYWNDNSQYEISIENINKKDNNNNNYTYNEDEDIKNESNNWIGNINDIMSSWKINNDNHQFSSVIHEKCPSIISDKGYRCCVDNCVSIYTDSNGNWGIENGEWCWCKNDNQNNN
jgi:hypothetical protein